MQTLDQRLANKAWAKKRFPHFADNVRMLRIKKQLRFEAHIMPPDERPLAKEYPEYAKRIGFSYALRYYLGY